jgi:hypothetical protein
MLVYNVTAKVDWSIHDEWVQWMLTEHMPELVNTGCFTNTSLLRILEIDEEDGPTYAAQYFAENKENYDRYVKEYAPTVRKKYNDKWGDRVVIFRTLMQIVE